MKVYVAILVAGQTLLSGRQQLLVLDWNYSPGKAYHSVILSSYWGLRNINTIAGVSGRAKALTSQGAFAG